jgi:hypothetical protein
LSAELRALLAACAPRIDRRTYVFTHIGHDAPVPLTAVSVMREEEGTSLVMREGDADALGLIKAFPCNLITLGVHSNLDSIGLLARITSELAAAGISVNPVAAFHHDYLFVPTDRADEALALLEALSSRVRASLPNERESV